jgi:hypothetical protein
VGLRGGTFTLYEDPVGLKEVQVTQGIPGEPENLVHLIVHRYPADRLAERHVTFDKVELAAAQLRARRAARD